MYSQRFLSFYKEEIQSCTNAFNRIGGVMFRVLASSVIDRGSNQSPSNFVVSPLSTQEEEQRRVGSESG